MKNQDVFSYVGNENETYYILKNNKHIMEVMLGEDEVLFLISILNKYFIY